MRVSSERSLEYMAVYIDEAGQKRYTRQMLNSRKGRIVRCLVWVLAYSGDVAIIRNSYYDVFL
jgi:hypothetical protein